MQQSYYPAHPGWRRTVFSFAAAYQFSVGGDPVYHFFTEKWPSTCCWASASAHSTPALLYPNTTTGGSHCPPEPPVTCCITAQLQRGRTPAPMAPGEGLVPRALSGGTGETPSAWGDQYSWVTGFHRGDSRLHYGEHGDTTLLLLKASGEVNLCTQPKSSMLRIPFPKSRAGPMHNLPQPFRVILGWSTNSLGVLELNF